jgi:hypothetical protein
MLPARDLALCALRPYLASQPHPPQRDKLTHNAVSTLCIITASLDSSTNPELM